MVPHAADYEAADYEAADRHQCILAATKILRLFRLGSGLNRLTIAPPITLNNDRCCFGMQGLDTTNAMSKTD
jgi:hypothetical protein